MKERKTETGTASNIAQNSLWECFCAILQIEGITLPAEKGAACQAGAVDFAAEVARLDKEMVKLDKEHAMLSGKLAGPNSKAAWRAVSSNFRKTVSIRPEESSAKKISARCKAR